MTYEIHYNAAGVILLCYKGSVLQHDKRWSLPEAVKNPLSLTELMFAVLSRVLTVTLIYILNIAVDISTQF